MEGPQIWLFRHRLNAVLHIHSEFAVVERLQAFFEEIAVLRRSPRLSKPLPPSTMS